jgi:hypothetical protein
MQRIVAAVWMWSCILTLRGWIIGVVAGFDKGRGIVGCGWGVPKRVGLCRSVIVLRTGSSKWIIHLEVPDLVGRAFWWWS